MDRRLIFVVVLAIVLVLGGLGIASNAYHLGLVQGMAQEGSLVAPPAGAPPYGYYGPPFHYSAHFGFFGLLFPLLFLFLVFALVRGVVWRAHWGHGGHHGNGERGVPPMFEEWHRRAHGPDSGSDAR